MSLYTKIIIELTDCAPDEAPLVEGFMRHTYRTLDGIDRRTFRRVGKTCLAMVRVDRKFAENNARNYGLIPKEKN